MQRRRQAAAASVSEPAKAMVEHASLKKLFDDYIADQKARGKRSYDKTQNRINQVLASQHITPDMPAKDVTPDTLNAYFQSLLRGMRAPAQTKYVRTCMPFLTLACLQITILPTSIRKQFMDLIATRWPRSHRSAEQIKPLTDFYHGMNYPRCWASFPFIRNNPNASRFRSAIAVLFAHSRAAPVEIMTNTKDNWDKKEKTLTVPPHISKTGDYHVIPLSDSATQILKVMEERYPKSGFLFPADTAEGHLLSPIREAGQKIL
jgi:hypothetical protein